jgi:RNA polymerase sigma-70 factor, ECF subfamily
VAHETEALYREHGPAVAGLCRSLLRDRNEAEDAAQQVFLSAHRALLNGSAPREPLAWLLAVARHECYARFRQRSTSPVPTGDVPDGAAPDASVHVLRAGELATVWDEVGQMPATQRQAFLLREVRGYSYGQLADELSLSPPSVRSLLLRARTRLRHRLRDVAAGIGGAPWVQALVRLAAGGEGASPVPAATKAAAAGIGALALIGGGDVALGRHHAAPLPTRSTEHLQAQARPRHSAGPAAVVVAPAADRHGFASAPDHSRSHGSSGSRSGSDDGGTSSTSSSGERSSDGGDDGGSTTTVVAQPTTDGRDSQDGGSSPPTGSGSDGGSATTVSDGSGSGSGSTGSDSGSDGSSGGSGDGSDSGSSGVPGG